MNYLNPQSFGCRVRNVLFSIIAVSAVSGAAAAKETAAQPPTPSKLHVLAVQSSAESVDPRLSDAYAVVDGVKLHYVTGGEGPAVLLIPGWLQTWYAWRDVIPALLDAGYRVVAADPRGMGLSDKPNSGYDTGTVGAEIDGLMHQIGYQRYSVVGHDIGMWIGYAIAADHPQSVERLAIMEAIIPGLLKRPPEVFMPQAQSAFFWQFMFNQQPDLPEMLIQGHERAFLGYLFDRWAYHAERITVDTYADIYSVPGALRAQMAYYRAFPETIAQNAERAKRKLTMPVLALGGDHAVKDFPETMMRPVAVNVKGGVLQNCGHFAAEECPEALLGELLPFLRDGR